MTSFRHVTAVAIAVSLVGAAPAASQDAAMQAYEAASARLERILSAYSYLESRIDIAQFDVAAKAEALGRDRERIFTFVRDEVRYEPYFGVLRGAKGTLMGLAGNAADQSVLLVELLAAAGFASGDVRFAAGALDGPRADALLAQFHATPPGPAGGPPLADQDLEQVAAILGPDWPAAQGIQAEVEDRALDLQEALWDDVEATRELITALLEEHGLSAGAADASVREEAMRSEARTHTWVQVRDTSGAWVDLDPSFADAAPGQAFAAADATAPALPDQAYHRLGVTVTLHTVTEVAGGAQTAEDQVLLDVSVRTTKGVE